MPNSDAYLGTVARIEPDIHMIDSAHGWASIAVSMRRIADAIVEAHEIMKAHTSDVGEHAEQLFPDGRGLADRFMAVARQVCEEWREENARDNPATLTGAELLALARVLQTANNVPVALGAEHQLSRDSEALLDVLSRNGISSVQPRNPNDPVADARSGRDDPCVLRLEEFLALRTVHQVAAVAALYGIVGPDGLVTTHEAIAKNAPAAIAAIHGLLIRAGSVFATDALGIQPNTSTHADPEPDNVLSDETMDALHAMVFAVHELPQCAIQVYAHMMGAGTEDAREVITAFMERW